MRVEWLGAEIIRAESPREAALRREWERALSIVEPVSTESAYARFGFCLGLFPPFAILTRLLLNTGMGNPEAARLWVPLFFGMNVVCCVAGWRFAEYLGRKMCDPRSRGWDEYIGNSIVTGMLWAVVTGGLGGFVGFGFGAVVGAICALPVAFVSFPVFAALHRVQSHGGMIEERDLRPIAYGIPLAAAAVILMWK